MIYLDTHIVVWLAAGQLDKLSSQARALINEENVVISPLIQLELQYLYEIKRVLIKPDEIIALLQKQIGLSISDMKYADIIKNAIKISWTRDPFDRLIVANAWEHNLITRDKIILNHYPKAIF